MTTFSVPFVLLLCLAPATALTASDGTPADAPARERLARTMAAVLERDDAAAVRARAAAGRAGAEAEAVAGAPVIEWQTEGVDSGFEREANAADSLRIRKEVALFGQRSSSRAYREQSAEGARASARAALLELAAAAGREWLELAAALERRDLVAHRLERFDRALVLHRKRLELGEIAGTEVRQLELERARDGARYRRLGLRVGELRGRLTRLAGEFEPAVTGDLGALAGALEPFDGEDAELTAASPFFAAVEKRRLAEERRADLVGKTAWGRSEAEAELRRIPAVDGAPSFDTAGFRIAVPLPVGKAGRARRAEAEAAASAARAEARAAELELRRRFDEARRGLATAETVLAELAAFETGLPRIERSLAEQFRLGAVTYLVYIDGLSRLDELRADLIDTRLALLRARLEIAVLLADPSVFPVPIVTLEEAS